MTIISSFVFEDTYIAVTCKGRWSSLSAAQLMQTIRRTANEQGYLHILIDYRDVSPLEAEPDIQQLAIQISEELDFPLRVALIENPHPYINIFPAIANNHGACRITFNHVTEGISWLIGHTPDQQSTFEQTTSPIAYHQLAKSLQRSH